MSPGPEAGSAVPVAAAATDAAGRPSTEGAADPASLAGGVASESAAGAAELPEQSNDAGAAAVAADVPQSVPAGAEAAAGAAAEASVEPKAEAGAGEAAGTEDGEGAAGDVKVEPAEALLVVPASAAQQTAAEGSNGLENGAGEAGSAAAVAPLPGHLTTEEQRLLDWHWANLEYGCSARLSEVCPPRPL